jgi:signal transduction histidine kinase
MTMTATRLPAGHRHALPDARRAAPDQLLREIDAVTRSPVVEALLQATDSILLVLNAQRQIVACNAVAWDGDAEAARGLRPGEALDCRHSAGRGGCGTARACETCGALGAILASSERQAPVEAECSVRSDPLAGGGLEFGVRSTPLAIDGHAFTVVALRDVSAEKRRDALEHIFFHDVLNTVTGLRGWVDRLRRPGADVARVSARIETLTLQVEREILDHRVLRLAERGELVPRSALLRPAEILQQLEPVFSSNPIARDRRLELDAGPPELELETDAALLLRVLVNMTRNALEATPAGGTVRVWSERARDGSAAPDAVRFSVRNAGVIPAEVQARIFERSFSTKAERGRGLGTYGMKLLGERYLGGVVSFVSTDDAGTVFSIRLPAERDAD